MKCLKCGSENSADARFCRGCGSGLNVSEPVATEATSSCPSCEQANVSGKKFCSKCGAAMTAQAPLSVEQPQQVVIKTETAIQVGEPNSCPKCGNGLKPAAKYCGKCGFSFEQQNEHHADELSRAAYEPAEAAGTLDSADAIEPVRLPPAAKADLPQAKPPKNTQPVAQRSAVSLSLPTSNSVKKGSLALIAIIIFLVCTIAGGAYWWFGLRQVVPSPVADVVNAQATAAVVTPASAVVEPVAAPSAAKVLPPAVVNPVQQPELQPVATSQSKKLKSHANKNGETNDDRKLLNAIDQYLDKQK